MRSVTGEALNGKVIHLHAPSVTNWHFNAGQYYGRTQASGVLGVSQGVVDAMVDRGLTTLLGLDQSAVAEAWRLLTPDYAPGDLVAIKINLNNSFSCQESTTAVDAIAQPVNAVVRGLKLRGVRSQDIVLYDAVRYFSDRLYQEIADKSVAIRDQAGCHGSPGTFNSSDPNALAHFSPPGASPFTNRLSDKLIQAKYLVNLPIMKGHPIAGVTLGFKNHFGSTYSPSSMHAYVSTGYSHINQYDGLVDLFSNPHIRGKTVLTLGDGIYGSRDQQDSPPQPWGTFGNASPCSLFLATDPVAIDCVMHDLLKAERGSAQPATSNAYLRLAENAGLGVFESGDPWQVPYGSGYTRISYTRIEM
jgi:hypothetical protein